MERLAKYGVNRADDRLWDAYDWFQQRFYEDEPVQGGLFDLNVTTTTPIEEETTG